MKMHEQLAFILVGDHLGQVKKVLPDTGEISSLVGCAAPCRSNPVVSIESIGEQSMQLIANKNGDLYIYDCIHDTIKSCHKVDDDLIKALPLSAKQVFLIYAKRVSLEGRGEFIKQKKGNICNAKAVDNKLALVGKDIPLKIFDIQTRQKIYEADPPEKDWLGIRPEVYVSGLDFLARDKAATCSKSDSVIRVYDTLSKSKPVISVDISQTAFNEHADSSRFLSIASTGDDGHSVVVGSNVGQILAIDLRFNVKHLPKKKLQPRNHKILGGFKGARGASIKDIKLVQANLGGDSDGYKVISCCLDRYLRIHNFTRQSRQLNKHFYMTTKPFCCSPVFYHGA